MCILWLGFVVDFVVWYLQAGRESDGEELVQAGAPARFVRLMSHPLPFLVVLICCIMWVG